MENQFQDKPCKHGHISPRRKNGNCIECEKIRGKTPEKLEAARINQAERRARIDADPDLIEKRKVYMREYSKNNRAKRSQQSIELYRKDNVRIRLKRKGINITPDILSYIENHDNCCDICGGIPDGRWAELSYDHCHESGNFRGLLCSACNRALGFFKDDIHVLEKAVNYLKHHEKLISES